MNVGFFGFIGYFLLDIVAGSNSPLFPFFVMSVIGNIIGILIVQPNPSPSIPKKGMLAGLFIFLSGFIVGLILKLPFGSYLPISNYSDITSIGNGIGGKWYPWFVFTTGARHLLFSCYYV